MAYDFTAFLLPQEVFETYSDAMKLEHLYAVFHCLAMPEERGRLPTPAPACTDESSRDRVD
jgi:hypothetical protein